jgi:hypothetical protein
MAGIDEISLESLPEALQAANLKLHLVVTAGVHGLVSDFAAGARELLLEKAEDDGTLGGVSGFSVGVELDRMWGEVLSQYRKMFGRARWEAGAIAFGGLARQHQVMMGEGKVEDEVKAEVGGWLLVEQTLGEASPVYDPQLKAVLDAAAQRMYGDGLTLSDRIWRLDLESRNGIKRTVLNGVANGDSAWNIAKDLETYLGANEDCPRWTSTRLSKLTPTDRMVSRRGLVVSVLGTPCESKGVAYKALRLARNEIQIAHQRATDDIWGNVPWLEQEQVMLSPDHPPIGCECEDVVAGGEDGEGIYPKGEITLPLHVQ